MSQRRPDLDRLRILHYPDPRLRERALAVPERDTFLDEIEARMRELMVSEKGIGLAAPQVGWGARFILINPTGEPGGLQALVDPVIIEREGKVAGEEGCLSVPGVWAKVKRAEKIRVRAGLPSGETVEFEAEGMAARVIQHELDHLEGGLFVDRLGPTAKIMVSGRLKGLEAEFEEGKAHPPSDKATT
jgi:peptide deformylase